MYISPERRNSYSVLVQPNVDEDGNLQPMVIDSKGRIIVDSYGYIWSTKACPPGQSCVGQKTQTAGIQEAINYIANLGGGRVYIRPGTYNINADIYLNANNIIIEGAGVDTTVLNTMSLNNGQAVLYAITQGQSPNTNVVLRRFTIKSGLNMVSGESNNTREVQSENLIIEDVKVDIDLSQATSVSGQTATVINWWSGVYLRNFRIRRNNPNKISLGDAMGIGSNIRFYWYGGYILDPISGGAAINFQGGSYSASALTYPVIDQYYDVNSGTVLSNTEYLIDGVDFIGDVAALSLYAPAWGVLFRGSRFYATTNTGALTSMVALQNAQPVPFEVVFDSCAFIRDNKYQASVGAEAGYFRIINSKFVTINNGNISILAGNTGQYAPQAPTYLQVENTQFIYEDTWETPFSMANPGQNGPFAIVTLRNLQITTSSGSYGQLFILNSNYNNLEILDVDGLEIQGTSANTSNPFILLWENYPKSSGTDAPGSYVSIKYRGKRFFIPLDKVTMGSGAYGKDPNPVPLFDATAFNFATPSLPSSGTVVQNTYPFSVLVYLYGGSVTEVQITKVISGSTYTVFSNSSGVSMSGQAFRLDPGDSITITYSSAPTWVWVPA